MRDIKFRAWDKNRGMIISELDFTGTYQGEIMQYTGLKDKNGKEIYEGDICKHQNPSESNYVEYRLGVWCLMPHGLYLHGEDMMVEVIGNIYENPELLK